MWIKLLRLFNPFAVIARELTALRELYEAELASRDKPIYRITESPRASDTTVSYEVGATRPVQAERLLNLFKGAEDDGEPDEDPED